MHLQPVPHPFPPTLTHLQDTVADSGGVIVDVWMVIMSWCPPLHSTHTNPTVRVKGQSPELQCLFKVKEDLSIDFSECEK